MKLYAVVYERYYRRPRSTANQGWPQIDSVWTDEDKAKARATYIEETPERDYTDGIRVKVLAVSDLDPDVPLAPEARYMEVYEDEPKQTSLEWTLECAKNDLKAARRWLRDNDDPAEEQGYKDHIKDCQRKLKEAEAKVAEARGEIVSA